jgi:hypothetical protein
VLSYFGNEKEMMNGRKGEATAEAYSIHVSCISSRLQTRVTQTQLKWDQVGVF